MNLVTMILACSLYPDNSITNAMVQVGSQNNPLTITISQNGNTTTKTFKTETEALNYANIQIAQGKVVNIGLLQIPNAWITKYPASMGANVAGLLRPCKNMVVATDLLNDATQQCASADGDKTACALSVYHTGSPTAGLAYAKQVIDYAVAHPFVKPPSILEQVPVTPDSAAIDNANNAVEGNTDATASSGNTNNKTSTINNSTTDNSNTDNLNDNTQQSSASSQTSSSDQNTSQFGATDQQNLPPVVDGNN